MQQRRRVHPAGSLSRMHLRSLFLLATMPTLTAFAKAGVGCILSTGTRYDTGADTVANYRLDVGKRAKILAPGEPVLFGEYPIFADGAISHPLIGEVPVTGHPS